MADDVIRSHWHESIAGISIVACEFYDAVETEVQGLRIQAQKSHEPDSPNGRFFLLSATT
jgi:hypothetical protein